MNQITRIDQSITFWFQRWPSGLHPYMLAITQLGSVGWIVSVSSIIAIVVYAKHHVRLSLAFAAILPGEALNGALKLLFNRARPHTQFTHDMFLRTKSFPSGHAFGSMMLYGLLAYLAFSRLPAGWNYIVGGSLILLIGAIGISRIYLGAHYALDVLGGWLLGVLVLAIVIKLTKI